MNRVVLVTGACGGIGSALSRRFVELGDTVLALDLDAEALEAFAAGLGADRVTPVVADLADAAAVQRAVAQAVKLRGPVDVLVANAGGAKAGTLASTDITSWQ
ncbi:MAG: SDR family NAD(P)-dependent oxidoreductase, partial [Paraburkholderia sp.]